MEEMFHYFMLPYIQYTGLDTTNSSFVFPG